MQKVSEGQLIEVDPAIIEALPANNARFGLKSAKIKEIADRIVEQGQIQPIEVSPLEKPINGFEYRLNVGNYRLAAIKLLNEQGAGLPVRAIVKSVELGKASTIRNLTENIARQDLTPMDEAVAIKKLMDVGVDKMVIRNMFSRSGRKGPVSNSWVNTTLSFLDLPVKVQNKIHVGEFDWTGAAYLAKVNRDNKEKLPEVLKELEESRQKAIEKEEREEEKFLNTLKRADEAEIKAKEAEAKILAEKHEREQKLQTAKDAVAKADRDNADLIAKAEKELHEATAKVKDDPSAGAKAVAEAVKFLDNVKKSAERVKEKAESSLKKLEEKYAKEVQDAKEAVKEAKEAKKEAKTAKEEKQPGGAAKKKTADKPTGAKEVAKAAAAVGASANTVKLSAKEIREVVAGLLLPGGSGKAETRINELGKLLTSCFDGVITDKQLYKKLLELFK